MIDNYFKWLCELVNIQHQKDSYYLLMGELYKHEFVPVVQRDINRSEDGIQLRQMFIEETGTIFGCDKTGDCSFLEMLIALAMDINDSLISTLDNTSKVFWTMVSNLDLLMCTDDEFFTNQGRTKIKQAVKRVNTRHIGYFGEDGLFPNKYCTKDQRLVEIWYQAQEYIQTNEEDIVNIPFI